MKRPEHSKLMMGSGNSNYKGGRKTFYCEYCGQPVKRHNCELKKKIFCSKNCYYNSLKVKVNKKIVYKLYFVDFLSRSQICKKLKVSDQVIKNVFKENNWKFRNMSEGQKLLNRRIELNKELLIKYYSKNKKSSIKVAKILNTNVHNVLINLHRYNIPIRNGKDLPRLLDTFGPKNPNWKGGASFLPYGPGFNKETKSYIRKRDNYTCQNCGMTEEEHKKLFSRKLTIHHINYNKENCEYDNLITTCCKCNAKANGYRDYWYAYYKYIIDNNLFI